MTIGAWCLLLLIFFMGAGLAGFVFSCGLDCESKAALGIAGVILVLTVAACILFFWYRSNSASGQRALKDQESDLNGGISRTVSVYDINGNLIQQYSGKFDIETDRESYILFDDEDGARHIIYYTTGTIIVDEN